LYKEDDKTEAGDKIPTVVFTVKAKIKALNYCSNHRLIRKGAMHFGPSEEVAVYNERRIKEYALTENRISVRGRHRSGLFKAKRIHIRFLEDLHLHKIEQPSKETLEFLNRSGILYFYPGSKKEADLIEILSFIAKQKWPSISPMEINDDQYLAAQKFANQLQVALAEKNFELILERYIHYPLVNKYWLNERKSRRFLSRTELEKALTEVFTSSMIQSVLNIDIETIYPGEKKMILGTTEVEISKKNDFKIRLIESW
jgi:hypothetical protein